MPEKFLILGAGSFYGSNFADYVEKRGDTAYRISHHDWNQRHFSSNKACQAMEDMPEYIVNFASKSIVAESWEQPEAWMHANATWTTGVFKGVLQEKIKKFIHVSTPEVYGDMDGWSDESYQPWRPSTPYAVSRAAADMMLMAYYRAYRFPALITRTANIYGRGQGANRIIPLAFDTIRRGEKLLLHGNGITRRSFIHVRDACAATYLLCKKGDAGQTYHISTTRDVSINDLVRKICRLLGKRPEDHVGTQPDRLGKDHAYLLNSDKIRNMGWRDEIQLEKGLEQYGQGA